MHVKHLALCWYIVSARPMVAVIFRVVVVVTIIIIIDHD